MTVGATRRIVGVGCSAKYTKIRRRLLTRAGPSAALPALGPAPLHLPACGEWSSCHPGLHGGAGASLARAKGTERRRTAPGTEKERAPWLDVQGAAARLAARRSS